MACDWIAGSLLNIEGIAIDPKPMIPPKSRPLAQPQVISRAVMVRVLVNSPAPNA